MKKNYFKSLMQVALLLAAPFVVSSCDDVIGQEDNPVASYVQWKTDADKAEISLKIGSTYTRTATAVSSAILAYESDNTEIASVDPVSGEVKALKEGSANISAVISGMSTNGRSVFEPTKLTYKVTVINNVAKLTRKIDSYVEYTANVDSTFDVSKFFTPYPAEGTGAEKSTVSYKLLDDTKNTYSGSKLGTLTGKSFKVGSTLENTKGIGDTLYIAAEIIAVGTEYKMPAAANIKTVRDTVMIVINKAIAYIDDKNERSILTADKYTAISEIDKTKFDGTFKAGTYFVDNALEGLGKTTLKAGGDVTFILGNAVNSSIVNFVDTKDASTLNIFRQANVATTPGGSTMKPVGTLTVNRSTGGDAITNFKAINIYGGEITASSDAANCGGFAAIGNINVNGGKLTAKNTTNGYGISLLDGGKLTIAGGDVVATGKGSSTSFGYAVIGDVEISKGTFEASNSDYRAVKGNMSASGKIKIKESANGSTYTELKTATSNAPYIQAK